MKAIFSPSLMCMDVLHIKKQIEQLNSYAGMLHVDIMDGHYVDNIALSPDFVQAIAPLCKIPIDCHLMVTNPSAYIDRLAKAGATYISPHVETINADAFRIHNTIKKWGCYFGVAINPATPLSALQEYIHLLDKITIMSVDPGFAGQPFIDTMVEKVKQAKQLKEDNNYTYLIEVDGGCNAQTFGLLKRAGVEVYVVGSSGLFNLDKNLPEAWGKMIQTFEKA